MPTHLVIGRNPSAPRARFIADIRDANLNPDLNTYRGFNPAATLTSAGLLMPRFGHHFAIRPSGNVRQDVYVGGGPYLSIQNDLQFDQRLVSLLGATAATYVTGSSLEIGNGATGQVAAQITGGYRLRLPLQGGLGSLRLEASYNHLQGLRYESIDLNLRLDTNARGFVALDPSRGAPLAIDRRSSTSGRGRSADLAIAAIYPRWRVTLRADGLGNQMTWRTVTHRAYEKSQLTGGLHTFSTRVHEPMADIDYRLPTQYRGQAAYIAGQWAAIAEFSRGLQRNAASMGLERRFKGLQVRGGGRYVDRIVLPSAGVSLRAGRTWFDIGAAMTTANIERQRNVIIASSVRLDFGRPPVPPVQPLDQ